MATGVLIAESLRVGAKLAVDVREIERVEAGELSAEQRAAGLPERWTLLHFEVADDDADRLAKALAAALDDVGWYADLHTADDSFVVFAGRVFRYARGDADGRARAEAHARALGVPEPQLDWP
jgi:hypothetical protein